MEEINLICLAIESFLKIAVKWEVKVESPPAFKNPGLIVVS